MCRDLTAVATALLLLAVMPACSKRASANRTSEVVRSSPPASVETKEGFEQYAKKLRQQSILKVAPQVFVPVGSRPPVSHQFPWRSNIVTTIFWIGEGTENEGAPAHQSAWNKNWMNDYGGFDTPDSSQRMNYIPRKFTPRLNPFYCALPYNDVIRGHFKPEAELVIPWFGTAYTEPGKSVCENRWIAIRKGNRTCYAQWQDSGPFATNHFQYVFMNERP